MALSAQTTLRSCSHRLQISNMSSKCSKKSLSGFVRVSLFFFLSWHSLLRIGSPNATCRPFYRWWGFLLLLPCKLRFSFLNSYTGAVSLPSRKRKRKTAPSRKKGESLLHPGRRVRFVSSYFCLGESFFFLLLHIVALLLVPAFKPLHLLRPLLTQTQHPNKLIYTESSILPNWYKFSLLG